MIGRELLGLFVDDGSLAVVIIAWSVAIGVALRWLGLDTRLAALLLVAGLSLALAENTRRAAHR